MEMANALAIYFQGARAYRFLQKQFAFPKIRVLRKNVERIRLRPSVHDAVLRVLKEKFSTASNADNMCVVSFDEMSVKSKPTYLRGMDMVEGFQDHGHLGRAGAVATHSLVLMVRGVTNRWKQAIDIPVVWNNQDQCHQRPACGVHWQTPGGWPDCRCNGVPHGHHKPANFRLLDVHKIDSFARDGGSALASVSAKQ